MNADEIREKVSDLWFALRSDRRTLPCYRDIRDNRRFFDVLLEVEKKRDEQGER